MLVLSRNATEKILIGDNVVVTVLKVKGNRVRIGVEAPKDMKILREEIEPDGDEDGLLPDVQA